ncbi:MAG: sensor histidine kinase [Bacteroidetes bacterium]|nr:sensor histidine kinase [Bacteroidota bacterium]
MAKIPFKVSARTARLIGRENIASSKGAIIELVKNGYDADSSLSIVYFDNKSSSLTDQISKDYYEYILQKGISESSLNKIYEFEGENYSLRNDFDKQILITLKKELSKFNSLYIIDDGEGMTQNIIREHWMTIGTDIKTVNVFTKDGRVKSGAKGIGRFALDKLGDKCEMITVFNPKNHEPDTDVNGSPTSNKGYIWTVDWSDFEGEFKTIDKVKADLIGINKISFKDEVSQIIENFNLQQIVSKNNFQYGTILKITDLREEWEDFYVQQVFSDLEVLVPAKETSDFKLFVFSSLHKNKYGEITGSICDDFDYKIEATINKEENIKIKIYRNEYDLELIDPEFFNRPAMQKYPYRKKDFENGYWEIERTFNQLIPGFADIDDLNTFANIGNFDFTFYYLKRTYDSKDAEKFFYKKFMPNQRKIWLGEFGGIKLFRDIFRVRPYGEVRDVSFDWLGLGTRKSQNPAGIAKKDGGYKVNPDNVSGAINISRLTNVNFEDKSSREGLQENQTFNVFKRIILGIISIFENDRAFIAREMSAYYDEKNKHSINRKKAEDLVKSILEESTNKSENENTGEQSDPQEEKANSEKLILAVLNKEKDEQIERLKDEQKILRGLASSGIVIASFSHEFAHLNTAFESRIDNVKKLIEVKIPEIEYKSAEDYENPFAQLEKIKKQDLKFQNWLKFSLGVVRKDKRRRKQLLFQNYFDELKKTWKEIFDSRGINMDITAIQNLQMRVFEIDFDSIFNNLIVNSINAFVLSKINRSRLISMKTYTDSREIILDYQDNGPGISPDIENPNKIFEALFTTKVNKHTGEEEGTGLGMWLVKSIVEDNDGKVNLLFPKEGFGLRIAFPIKYKTN